MARLNEDRQKELEPSRSVFAKQEITKLGFEIIFENNSQIQFIFKGEIITLFPYSGWHSGKTIRDGRGIKKLLNQIK